MSLDRSPRAARAGAVTRRVRPENSCSPRARARSRRAIRLASWRATRQTDDDFPITEATRAALSNDAGGWEERPPVTLKGKAAEVRLYASRVLDARE